MVAQSARDEKLENLIKNYSLILMGMFEEAFGDIAEKMTAALDLGTAAIVEALGASFSEQKSKVADKGTRKKKKTVKEEISPEVRKQIGLAFKRSREEMDSQWPKNPGVFKKFISDSRFDKGIAIVEKYDFGIPRLTERIGDEVLASYILLLKKENRELGNMFKELAEWQAGLPEPPWATRAKN